MKYQKAPSVKTNTTQTKAKTTVDIQSCCPEHHNFIHAKISHYFHIQNQTFDHYHTSHKIEKQVNNMIQLVYYFLFIKKSRYLNKKLYINKLYKYVILKISQLWKLLFGIDMLKLIIVWKVKLLCFLVGGLISIIKSYP